MRNFLIISTMFFLVFAQVAFAASGEAEQKGIEIVREWERRDSGFIDQTAQMEMVLKNRHGQESSRRLRIKTLEVKGDGDKSLSVFDNPRDIKGTALLTFSHKTGTDDQWLYLPALKRVKRISSANKSGSFMGSEFAFEDIGSQEVEKYTYKFVGEEKCGDQECFIIEYDPVDEYSGYTRQLVQIDKKEYRIIKVDYYDRKNAHLKTLEYNHFKRYGKVWRAASMFMINHQTGKSTLLKWTDYKFGTGLKQSDFNKNALKRVR